MTAKKLGNVGEPLESGISDIYKLTPSLFAGLNVKNKTLKANQLPAPAVQYYVKDPNKSGVYIFGKLQPDGTFVPPNQYVVR